MLNCSACERPAKAKGLCAWHYEKELFKKNPGYLERRNAYYKKWRESNRGKTDEYAQIRRAKDRADPDRRAVKSKRQVKRRYKLNDDEYQALLRPCDICASTKSPRVDHCHKSGHVRGRLCHRCNVLLGHIENTVWLHAALRYLINPPGIRKNGAKK